MGGWVYRERPAPAAVPGQPVTMTLARAAHLSICWYAAVFVRYAAATDSPRTEAQN